MSTTQQILGIDSTNAPDNNINKKNVSQPNYVFVKDFTAYSLSSNKNSKCHEYGQAFNMQYHKPIEYKKGDKVFANPYKNTKCNVLMSEGIYIIDYDAVKPLSEIIEEKSVTATTTSNQPAKYKINTPVVLLFAVGVGLLIYAFKGN